MSRTSRREGGAAATSRTASKRDTAISRFLSLVLRHDPSAAGVRLDENGWADVEAIVAGAPMALTAQDVARVVATSDKRRFALSPDGRRIRANQGHSVEIALGLSPLVPPAALYHGTYEAALPAILREGLSRMERHHVHLSEDVATATRVGARRGAPVVLRIDAMAMHAEGTAFYRSDNGVWLVDAVPPRFLSVVRTAPNT